MKPVLRVYFPFREGEKIPYRFLDPIFPSFDLRNFESFPYADILLPDSESRCEFLPFSVDYRKIGYLGLLNLQFIVKKDLVELVLVLLAGVDTGLLQMPV